MHVLDKFILQLGLDTIKFSVRINNEAAKGILLSLILSQLTEC
jgi:hypothetical protein